MQSAGDLNCVSNLFWNILKSIKKTIKDLWHGPPWSLIWPWIRKEMSVVVVVVVVWRWRAHVDHVTCMALADDDQLLITSSLDCTARVWTFSGHYIGTSTSSVSVVIVLSRWMSPVMSVKQISCEFCLVFLFQQCQMIINVSALIRRC